MVNDSISYINRGQDSLVNQDSILHSPFSIGIVKGEIVDLVNRKVGDNISADKPVDHRHEGIKLPFAIEHSDSVFIILLFCFIFFAHIYHGGFSFLKDQISFLFSSGKNDRMHGQTTVKEVLYGYFLLFQAIVLISVCAYDVFLELDLDTYNTNSALVTITSFILLIALFFGVKDFIYMLLGIVFDMDKMVNSWRRIYIMAMEVLGMLYFIPTLFLIYANYYHFQIVVFMLILFLIVHAILFYQIISFFIREKFNFLYLIAYLCTFEILPYIFLIMGLVYLYRIDVFNIL